MGNVMVIPAKRQVGNTARQQDAKPKLRVAAYCRVSTDSDEQATSYDAQVEHYTEFIQKTQNGQVQVNHNHFLGYTKDADGNLIIDPEQAEVVKRIYREYLDGYSMDRIAKGLEADASSPALAKQNGGPAPSTRSLAISPPTRRSSSRTLQR